MCIHKYNDKKTCKLCGCSKFFIEWNDKKHIIRVIKIIRGVGLFLVILAGVIGFILLCIKGHEYSKKQEKIDRGIIYRYELKQIKLNTSQNISGSFFMIAGFGGGGISSGEEKLYYFYANIDGIGFRLYKIPYEKLYIVEDGGCYIEMSKYAYNRFICKEYYVCRWYITAHIPKDSIAVDYKLKIE